MKHNFFLCGLLTACTSAESPPNPIFAHGPWHASPSTCRIRAAAADFTLTTTGKLEKENIILTLTFTPPLAAPPKASSFQQAYAVEGRSNIYRLQLPFTPQAVKTYMDDQNYLTIAYIPQGAFETYESSIPTQGLIQTLTEINKTCP